jgi:hypothetical protein
MISGIFLNALGSSLTSLSRFGYTPSRNPINPVLPLPLPRLLAFQLEGRAVWRTVGTHPAVYQHF